MDQLLTGLKAAAEPTRMRLLKICAQQELTVSELTQILGQSQPRISRHLKLLCDAGLMERVSEGAWAYFHLARLGAAGDLARQLVEMVPNDDTTVVRDRGRLATVMEVRAVAAANYFSNNAESWDKIRSLHVEEPAVERALLRYFPAETVDDYLDIGTGTGRLLNLLGDRARVCTGVDASREMLAVARANLAAANRHNCTVRQGDMYDLPWSGPSFDAITLHMVLHYAADPAAAIIEAVRVLRPGGRLLIVDFAPHNIEALRSEEAHQRMGFSDLEIRRWLKAAGLVLGPTDELPGDPLTVVIWTADGRQRKEAA